MERTETTEKKLATPSTEVLEKPARRRFPAQYKLRILAQADGCTEMGQVGELLRREGLFGCGGQARMARMTAKSFY